MTKTIKTFGILVLLLIGLVACVQNKEENLVRKSFDNYKAAILNDKGEEAVKYLDSRTVNYYTKILELIRTADSTKIETLSIMDKLMVLYIRQQASKEDILSFDGKSLLIYAIKNGMVGKNSVVNNSIGDVIVNKNFAKGQFKTNGQETPVYLYFYKEEGQWKIDLTSGFIISNIALKKMADESGQPQNEYLFSLIEMITGSKPGHEIWEPIN